MMEFTQQHKTYRELCLEAGYSNEEIEKVVSGRFDIDKKLADFPLAQVFDSMYLELTIDENMRLCMDEHGEDCIYYFNGKSNYEKLLDRSRAISYENNLNSLRETYLNSLRETIEKIKKKIDGHSPLQPLDAYDIIGVNLEIFKLKRTPDCAVLSGEYKVFLPLELAAEIPPFYFGLHLIFKYIGDFAPHLIELRSSCGKQLSFDVGDKLFKYIQQAKTDRIFTGNQI